MVHGRNRCRRRIPVWKGLQPIHDMREQDRVRRPVETQRLAPQRWPKVSGNLQ